MNPCDKYFFRKGKSFPKKNPHLDDSDCVVTDADGRKVGFNPLSLAINGGQPPFVQMLLDAGADADIADDEGDTSVHYACGEGKSSVILKLLIAYKCNVNAPNRDKMTPLHIACLNSNTECVRVLLDAGAYVNARNLVDKSTPLMIALSKLSLPCVRLLLNAGADATLVSVGGLSSIHFAANLAKCSFMKLILKKKANLKGINDIFLKDGLAALHMALRGGNVKMISLLLESGADPDIRDCDGLTPLLRVSGTVYHHSTCPEKSEACEVNDVEKTLTIMQLLLKHNAGVNKRSSEDQVPLTAAASSGRLACVNLLLANGADPNLQDNEGDTALHETIASQQRSKADLDFISIIKALLCHAKLNPLICNKKNFNYLQWAAFHGDDRIFKMCYEKLSQLRESTTTRHGSTLLHIAAVCGHDKVLRHLLRSGAKVDSRDKEGRTPLLCAIKKGKLECARLLHESGGADIKAKDAAGNTILHMACYNSNLGSFDSFLKHEVIKDYVDVKNDDGETCLMIAVKERNKGAVMHISEFWHASLSVVDNRGRTVFDIAEFCGTSADVMETLAAASPALPKLLAATAKGDIASMKNIMQKEKFWMKKTLAYFRTITRCPICKSAKPAVWFVCGHGGICESCSKPLRECDVCGKKITLKIKLF